ncbi:MAG: hemin-degrading factor, partial [Chitinophagaceae bacterium]|nr:hemin-degrading factor [Chitinophagaceae bacterium]
MSNTIAISLKEQYESLKSANPKLRIRNAAQEMNVSEAQLVAISDGATLLKPLFQEILKEVIKMGEVMALTRNDSVVHERKGVYDNISF